MASKNNYLSIQTLRGGLSDNEPPLSISEDMCQVAENVEYFYSTMGERRLGCKVINMSSSISGDPTMTVVPWLGHFTPTNNLADAELWVLGTNTLGTSTVLTRRGVSAWTTVTVDDPIIATSGKGHNLSAVSLHGKYFVAYDSGVDFLHVYDGNNLRQTGLAAPVPPLVADSSTAGTYTGTRYFRVRLYKAGSGTSNIALRSEPSAVTTFIPGGTKNGAVISRPAVLNGATHWEVEASTDAANFYMMSRVVIGTTTYTDTIAYASGYSSGILSEDLTTYTRVPSGKFLGTESDRLIVAGSWENPNYASRVWWTPVLGDGGVGSDERLDMTVNPFVDLDGFDGGEITGLSESVGGYFYVFKWGHIYKLVKTNQRENAYNVIPMTKARGALPGTIVEAVDRNGNPAIYFLDPKVGPMRLGVNGLEWCGNGVRGTWARVNASAEVVGHGVFYEAKNQVHFWISVDGANHPNMKLVIHCDELTSGDKGATRGWTSVPVGDRIADAHCSHMFASNVDEVGTPRNLVLVPFIGKEGWDVLGTQTNDLVQRCDTGSTDCFTTGDTAAYYYAKIKTKPFVLAGLTNKFGMMNASIACTIAEGALNGVYLQAIRDFGLETQDKFTVITDSDAQDFGVKVLDDFKMSEAYVLELEFGDLNTSILPTANWRLHAFSAKIRSEQSS